MQSILNLNQSKSNHVARIEHKQIKQAKINNNMVITIDISKIVKVAKAFITAIGLTVGAIDLEKYQDIL